MANLELEYRDEFFKPQDKFTNGNCLILVTPPLNENYWVFRIKLYKEQSLIAFPKFNTMGIGFAQEINWNSNLPYICDTEKIYKHSRQNKLYKQITKKTCIEAIQILQKACKYYKEYEQSKENKPGNINDFFSYLDNIKSFIETK